jgi:hypothetical protein
LEWYNNFGTPVSIISPDHKVRLSSSLLAENIEGDAVTLFTKIAWDRKKGGAGIRFRFP